MVSSPSWGGRSPGDGCQRGGSRTPPLRKGRTDGTGDGGPANLSADIPRNSTLWIDTCRIVGCRGTRRSCSEWPLSSWVLGGMGVTSCVAKKREGGKKEELRVQPDFITFAVGQAIYTALTRRRLGRWAGRLFLLRSSDGDHTSPRVVKIGTAAVRRGPPPPQQG